MKRKIEIKQLYIVETSRKCFSLIAEYFYFLLVHMEIQSFNINRSRGEQFLWNIH